MDITEFCQVAQKKLVIQYMPKLGRWQAKIEGAEIKEDGCLRTAFGAGSTPDEAISDYIDEISGETLVFDAYRDNRKELGFPARSS